MLAQVPEGGARAILLLGRLLAEDVLETAGRSNGSRSSVNNERQGQFLGISGPEPGLQSSVSGVSTDALLFSQSGVPLVHRYRVFSQSGTHISLRGNYMTKLQAFTEQADAERRVSHKQDLARLLASRINPDIQHGVRRQ